MQRFAANDKLPLSVMVAEVKEVYLHCAKAIRRAGLWDATAQIDRDQLALSQEIATIDAALEKDAKERLY